MPHLDIATFTGQIFWLAITFATLYFVLSKALLPKVAEVLEERAKFIADDLANAESMKNEVLEQRAKYEQVIALATANARKTMEEASLASERKIAEKKVELQRKIEASLQQAEKKIAEIENESTKVISKISDDVAQIMAKKLVA